RSPSCRLAPWTRPSPEESRGAKQSRPTRMRPWETHGATLPENQRCQPVLPGCASILDRPSDPRPLRFAHGRNRDPACPSCWGKPLRAERDRLVLRRSLFADHSYTHCHPERSMNSHSEFMRSRRIPMPSNCPLRLKAFFLCRCENSGIRSRAARLRGTVDSKFASLREANSPLRMTSSHSQAFLIGDTCCNW